MHSLTRRFRILLLAAIWSVTLIIFYSTDLPYVFTYFSAPFQTATPPTQFSTNVASAYDIMRSHSIQLFAIGISLTGVHLIFLYTEHKKHNLSTYAISIAFTSFTFVITMSFFIHYRIILEISQNYYYEIIDYHGIAHMLQRQIQFLFLALLTLFCSAAMAISHSRPSKESGET